MVTCKECLHWSLCSRFDGTTRFYGREMACGNVDALCNAYEDRSKYVVREKGEWILDGNKILCSSCRTVFYELEESEIFGAKADLPYLKEIEKFCFNCGADMRKGDV